MADETPTEVVPNTDQALMELPPPAEDVVVLARNPQEMQDAQQQLLAWANSKVAIEQAEVREAELNLEQAKKLKIRTLGWKSQVTSRKKRLVFYEKLRDAVTEGYHIVPNFPFQVIGVRTDRVRPPSTMVSHDYMIQRIHSNQLPKGRGRYVSPTPLVTTHTRRVTDPKTHTEKEVTKFRASDFDDFDFPFKLVKPKILSDLDRAMKLKIFDEIGVLPAARVRGPDPMVVGTLRRREGAREHIITFLITWWIDTRDL